MDERLRDLLTWLKARGMRTDSKNLRVECKTRGDGAGYGLFASKMCPATTTIFTVPASAMINTKTLGPHYPCGLSLTATQLISLHICLYRPLDDDASLDPLFGPYISVLPRNFASHPVVWLVKQDIQQDGFDTQLLKSLPPTAVAALRRVCSKYWDDWRAVCQCMQKNLDVLEKARRPDLKFRLDNSILCMDFLWAWLNVNTRCIYYQLKASRTDPDNLTMCPILDFANHTSTSRHMSPIPIEFRSWNAPSLGKSKGQLAFLSPRDALQAGEEVFLCYGAHANRTLFVEYGFANELPESAAESDEYNGEVDVQDIVERLFEDKGTLGLWMKSTLEDNGYWGDWTLHASPRPAYPSFRLIAALRLYHLVFDSASDPATQQNIFEPWQDTILGRRSLVSNANETAWRSTLLNICAMLLKRAEVGMHELETQTTQDGAAWLAWMRHNIWALWKEEAIVAAAVAQSVATGEQF